MTHNNKYMPSGYKDSPLGVIPQEWEVKRLGEVAKKIGSGVTPKGGEAVYQEQGRYFIRSQNVGWGHLLLDDVAFIDEATHNRQVATELQDKDILLNITGASIGRSTIVTNEIVGGNVNQHVCIIRLKNGVEAHFVCSYLLSDIGQRLIDSYQAGGNRQGLNFEQIKSFIIPLPPLAEQRRIAEILGTWDIAIERQGRKVALLQSRKRAIMQRLLTPKPHWQKTKLGKYIKEHKEKPQLGVEYEIYTSSKNGLMKQTDYYGDNRITNRIDVDYNVIPSEFITYRSRSDDGLFTFNKNKSSKGLVSGYYPVFTISIGNTDFILEYLNYFKVKLTKYSIGTSQLVLSFSALYNAKFELPDETEQKSIAERLSTADTEIDLARRRLDLFRTQKRALMQQLLTGKKQLKI